METSRAACFVLASILTICKASAILAADTTLTIESWRNDDTQIWRDKIIPAFEKTHPSLRLSFQPTDPKEYSAALDSKLDLGAAGDIIACRPFEASLELFKRGQLTSVNGIRGIENFTALSKAAWSTDDGSTTYCVPVASVLHGFIYNKDAFQKAGIATSPKTSDEFVADLEAIKKNGTYVPVAMGTFDKWEAATMGFQNIGPSYWRGEEGRQALIAGKRKLTDPEWVAPFTQLAKWGPYMGEGFKGQPYTDSQTMFTDGRAAIYPSGSWEIAKFVAEAKFPLGAFPPPVEKVGDACYVTDQPIIGFGMNSKSKNPEAAKTFLTWVASPEFARIYSNSLPGFFSLQTEAVQVDNTLSQEFLGFRRDCKSTLRLAYQILLRGLPNLERAIWVESANVLNGTTTPEQAAQKLQQSLDSWYHP